MDGDVGLDVRSVVSASDSHDGDAFSIENIAQAREYYEREGYVVLRGLLKPEQCDDVVHKFNRDVRHTRTPILRQKNMRYEANRFDADGFLTNPIFNAQDLQTNLFGGFKSAVLDLFTSADVAFATANLLDTERTKVIQSMFFEAPAGTWAHQDSYYQDSASALGQAVAGWFALEDIDEDAGRFFVCPGSHRSIPVLRNEGKNNFAQGHETYKQTVADLIKTQSLSVVAPALSKGDVLFWNSCTIHGSFAATRPGSSRLSLTAHYLRESDEMLQFHTRIRHQPVKIWNGMKVGLLHNQDHLKNRMVRNVAFRFPGPYMLARKLALKALLKARRSPPRA